MAIQHNISGGLVDALVRARVIEDPNYVRRVVIDIEVGQPTKVYVERFGDMDRLIGVIESVGIEIKQARDGSAADSGGQ